MYVFFRSVSLYILFLVSTFSLCFPVDKNLYHKTLLEETFSYSHMPSSITVTDQAWFSSLSPLSFISQVCVSVCSSSFMASLFSYYIYYFFFPIKNVIDQMLWKEQTLSFHIPLHSCLFLYQWLKKQRGARWGWSWSKPTSFWHHLERDFASLLQQHRLEGGKGGEVLSERKQKKMWVVLEWSS